VTVVVWAKAVDAAKAAIAPPETDANNRQRCDVTLGSVGGETSRLSTE
jgi:hypothetical protein